MPTFTLASRTMCTENYIALVHDLSTGCVLYKTLENVLKYLNLGAAFPTKVERCLIIWDRATVLKLF